MGCIHLRNRVNPDLQLALRGKKEEEDLEQNAAVDYALKNNDKHKISYIELIASCKNLPNTDPFSMPNPLVVLYVDKTSLNKAQKLQQYTQDEDDKVAYDLDWQEYGRTEIR